MVVVSCSSGNSSSSLLMAQDFIWFVIVYMLSYLLWWTTILEQTRVSSLSPVDMGHIEGLFLGMTTRGEILMKPSFPSFP